MRAADVDRRLSESCRSWRRRRGNVTPGDRETVDTELKLPRTSTLGRWNHVRIPGKDRRHRLIRGTGSSRRPRFHRRRPQVARTRAKSPECCDRQHGAPLRADWASLISCEAFLRPTAWNQLDSVRETRRIADTKTKDPIRGQPGMNTTRVCPQLSHSVRVSSGIGSPLVKIGFRRPAKLFRPSCTWSNPR